MLPKSGIYFTYGIHKTHITSVYQSSGFKKRWWGGIPMNLKCTQSFFKCAVESVRRPISLDNRRSRNGCFLIVAFQQVSPRCGLCGHRQGMRCSNGL